MSVVVGGSALLGRTTSPVIDFTSLDYAAIRADLITFIQSTFSDRWTDFNPSQFAVVFLDLISYYGDLLTFNLNTSLREATVTTCQRRQHLVDNAKTYDYTLASAGAGSTNLTVNITGTSLPLTLLSTYQYSSGDVIFQPVQDTVLALVDGISQGDGTYNFTVPVVEGQGFTDVSLGVSDGTSEQTFPLNHTPLIDGTLTVKVNGSTWTAVTSFTLSQPTDIHYRVETTDDGSTTIFFGDGVNGKIPPSTQTVTATWKIGGGRRGNVGANTITSIDTPVTGLNSVTNPLRVEDGADQETLAAAKSAIPKSLVAGDRAVTLADYAIVAKRSTTSVQKAFARSSADGAVEIGIVPEGGGAPSDPLKTTVATYVNARRSVGQVVRIIDPVYDNVSVVVDAFVDASSNKITAGQVVRNLFLTSDTTDVQDAIFDLPNVGFGARDDSGKPQLTLQRMYDLLGTLSVFGIGNTRLTRFTNKPSSTGVGIPDGNGAFTFTTTDVTLKARRQWRVKFSSPTTYSVWERVFGTSTSLVKDALTDDRANFPTFPVGAIVNPDSSQSGTAVVDSVNSTATTVRRSTTVSGTLLSLGNVGDAYYVEWTAGSGTADSPFTPVGKGISFTFATGSIPYANGDEFLITVFAEIDDLLMPADKVPLLNDSDLVVNVKSAL